MAKHYFRSCPSETYPIHYHHHHHDIYFSRLSLGPTQFWQAVLKTHTAVHSLNCLPGRHMPRWKIEMYRINISLSTFPEVILFASIPSQYIITNPSVSKSLTVQINMIYFFLRWLYQDDFTCLIYQEQVSIYKLSSNLAFASVLSSAWHNTCLYAISLATPGGPNSQNKLLNMCFLIVQ